MTKLGCIVFWIACGAAVRQLQAGENDWFVPLGPPPRAAPRRISGGEGMPPLPLPATPLRRTERKREPSPPKLLAKVIWGDTASFTYDNGVTTRVSDWNLCPADTQQLLRKASIKLGAPYGAEALNLGGFDGDPAKMPILFFSGSRRIKFAPRELDLLRSYVLRGGMIVADDVAGSPYFYASFRQAMERAFPELRFHRLPPDHPIFHIFYDIDDVRYPKDPDLRSPFLEGMYVYSRIGVLISKYGLGCGWDDHEVPLLSQAHYYDVRSANELGVNLVAYALGYAEVGREESKTELAGALDRRRPTDEFVFGQIEHDGAWNVHSGGIPFLLRQLRRHTSMRLSLKRVPVVPGKDDLSSFTFLYLTGLDDFHWNDGAIAALRSFLSAGGALLVNNGLGLATFDAAARRELKRLLPDAELQPLPLTHPIFHSFFQIDRAQYTPAARAAHPDLAAPQLEGIVLSGDLKVIYSPFDLEAGWEGVDHPLAKAFQPASALELGMNIVLYAMTH